MANRHKPPGQLHPRLCRRVISYWLARFSGLTPPGVGSLFGAGVELIPYTYLEERSGRYDYYQRLLVGLVGIGVGWHSPMLKLAITLRAVNNQPRRNK